MKSVGQTSTPQDRAKECESITMVEKEVGRNGRIDHTGAAP